MAKKSLRRAAPLAAALLLAAGAAAQQPPAPTQAGPPPAAPLALVNATVIDGTGAPPRAGMTIVIREGRIAELHPSATRPAPAGSRVLDLAGRTVIPGLVEAHTHLQDFFETRERPLRELERMLYGGVVAIREMAGDARVSGELARAARLGQIASPDVYYATIMMGPHFRRMDGVGNEIARAAQGEVGWIQVVTPETDLRLAVARAAGTGATGLKLYIEMEPALVEALTREAHAQGLRVWAHPAVFPSSPIEVVRAGVDGISHACGLAWQHENLDPRRLARITRENRPVFDPRQVDAGSPAMRELYAEMARRGTFFDATFSMYPRRVSPFGCDAALMTSIARAAHRAGVHFLTGTDWHAPPEAPYPSLHDEIEALVEHGILSPLEAITAATRNGADVLGILAETGTVEVGKWADLVILDRSPAEDIGAIRSVHATLKRGQLYPRADFERGHGGP